MDSFFTDVWATLTDMMFYYLIVGVVIMMLTFTIQDAKLQHTQHALTREVNVLSGEMSKAGTDDTGTDIRYGEPFTVSRNRTFTFMRNPINMTETRSGVNRGKFTTDGYIYK